MASKGCKLDEKKLNTIYSVSKRIEAFWEFLELSMGVIWACLLLSATGGLFVTAVALMFQFTLPLGLRIMFIILSIVGGICTLKVFKDNL